MEIKKFRILEWSSKFAGCPPRIEYELQSQTSTDPVQWETLGTSLTLEKARKALLFHAANSGCGLS
jgi:hypothetical protein